MMVALLVVGIGVLLLLGALLVAIVAWGSRLSGRMSRLEASHREERQQALRLRVLLEVALLAGDAERPGGRPRGDPH